jgi:molecular chaperone DnaK
VGDPAKDKSGNKSYKTIASIKRFMGHSFLESQRKEFLTSSKRDNNTPRVDIDGRLYTAQLSVKRHHNA